VIDTFPPPKLSMFAIPSGDWVDDDAQGLKRRVRRRLIGRDKPINGTVSVWGEQANVPDFSLEYTASASDLPVFKQSAAALWFSIASTEFGSHRDTALRVWRELAVLLGCSAGYVDIALEGHRLRMQALAKRYRYVDISSVENVAWDLEERLPGAFWVNYLGPQLVSALGGRAAVTAALSTEASIENTGSGGLVVTFGANPSHGDVNRKEDSDGRGLLARLANTSGLLHVPRKVRYFEAEEGLSDEEAQTAWHLRLV
jgi:hypothetical protein